MTRPDVTMTMMLQAAPSGFRKAVLLGGLAGLVLAIGSAVALPAPGSPSPGDDPTIKVATVVGKTETSTHRSDPDVLEDQPRADGDEPHEPGEPDEEQAESFERVLPPWAPSGAKTADAKTARTRLKAPRSLEPRVRFWQRVWTEVPDEVHLLVDKRRPWVVHAKVTCPKGTGHGDASCQRRINRSLDKAKRKLRKLARRPTKKHRRAYGGDKSLIKTASSNIIRVAGKRDKLRRAIVRAGDDLARAEQVFAAEGLPRDLARLAFVESLFRPAASSRSGAVGVFQFTATTGRTYLTIDDDIDERLDPMRSALAAAQYLKEMRGSLPWSLATTAYNTGPTRMRRLVREHRTRDLEKLVRKSRDPRFGFDGQNYHAQLLAVIRATSDLSADLAASELPVAEALRLKVPMSVAELAKELGVSERAVAQSNPALRGAITKRGARIPVSYLVNVPAGGETLTQRPAPADPRGS